MKQRIVRPVGSAAPSTRGSDFIRAVENMTRDVMARSREVTVGQWALGCDGLPIVSIGDGTSCHDDAVPGKMYLVASPLRGVQLPVMPLNGRAFTGNQPDIAIFQTALLAGDHGEPAMAWPVPEFVSEARGYLWKPVKAVRVHD